MSMLSSMLALNRSLRRCVGVRRGIPFASRGPAMPRNSCSRLIGSHFAPPCRIPGEYARYPLHRILTRPAPLLQTCRLSTQEDASRHRPNLLIDPSEKLPDIYASPLALLEKFLYDDVVPLDSKSVYIAKDGEYEEWHTSAYTDARTKEQFHSGTFGGYWDRMAKKSQWDAPAFFFEETCVVNGRVYYQSEKTAKEAAVARALDCLSFRLKQRPFIAPSSSEPLRYCEELPYFNLGGKKAFNVPSYHWACLMQSKYGPVDVKFDVQATTLKNGNDINGRSELEETWYTATCIEPKTGESFDAGVFGSSEHFARLYNMPDAPKTPLQLEEVRTHDGRVYYRVESTAKHAAAARALDCINYRVTASGNGDGKKDLNVRLCMEEPYLTPDDKQRIASTTKLKQLEEAVERRRQGQPGFSFSDFIKLKLCEGEKSHPLHLLEEWFRSKYNMKVTSSWFGLSTLEDSDGFWYTAIFTDPISKEEFGSGIVRAPKDEAPDPYHTADIRIIDGAVYYSGSAQDAIQAAAAWALDCYVMRDKGIDGESYVPFCYEEPHMAAEEGASQTNDYGVLLAQRNEDITSLHNTEHNPFSPFAKSKPYLLHVPKNFLYNAFVRAHGIEIGMDAYEVEMQEIDGNWYTATFTDPVTKETFSSGLGREINAKKRRTASLSTPLHQAEATVLSGSVYYREKRLAEHAAAARAVDCYLFREGDCSSDIRLCHEEPYSTAEEGRSQTIDYDTLLAQRGSVAAEGYAEPAPISRTTSSTFSSFAKTNSYLLHVPQSFLNGAFGRVNGISIQGRNTFSVQMQDIGGKSWYTATFTDPITREIFPSGLGREINVDKRTSNVLGTPLHQAETTVLDGRVYYREEKLAEHAAAARAVDCYFFREGDSMMSDLRLCLEDPYISPEEGRAQKVDYDALLTPRGSPPAVGDHLSAEFDRVEVSYPAIETTENELPSLDLLFTEEPTKIDRSLSTMGRIAEIWTDAASGDLDSSGGTSPQWSDEPLTELDNDPQSKIESILQWYDGIENEPRNHAEASELAHLCNKILSALGKVIEGLDLEEAENHTDVEGDARIILDRILSLSSTFGAKNDPSFFNADTFNAYIHCLDRLDPARSAKVATQLLRSMIDGEEFDDIDLPPPNVGTYNSVMSLWAQVDGVEGQNGVNDVYALLESASHGGDGGISLRPNKDTFNILLAANSKTDARFSFEQAKAWLDKIQHISDSICGEAFVPDAGVYSAALTSLSSKANADPTSSQCGKSWLTRGHRYDGGFKSGDNCSNAEATDIAEWLLHAEECGVAPSREMYEAVIQAWTETGTKEGLLTAEAWASRYIRWAVESGSPIRLETFHPIIAAWALCQLERAPDRVSEWNEQLTSLGATRPALKPDLNTISAQVIAWRNVQAGIMATSEETMQLSAEDFNAQRDVEKAFAIAQNCTQYLKEVFADDTKELKSQQDAAAVTSMFTHTIESWGCASRFALRHPTSSVTLDASRGVDEVFNVARLFDAKMNQSETEERAQRMLSVMGESFAEVISQLHQIDSAIANSATDSDAARCYFSDKLPHVERMLRDYEFYSRKHLSPGSFSPESKATRHRLYGEILLGCAGIKSSADFGHVMRIGRLIMDHLAWQSEHCPEGGAPTEQDITDLFVDMALLAQTAVPIVEERMYTLATMHVHADQFFEKRRKSEASAYATVDRARLIGAMRMAMGDSELTEEFIQRIDGRSKTNARGNTALAFVEELLRK